MEEKIKFFTSEQHTTILNKFKGRLDSINTEDEFEMARNSHIKTIIHAMAKNPEEWDNYCEINIAWIGDSFISNLSNQSEKLTKNKLDDIFSVCFRFLFELYLSTKNELAREFERARIFAFQNIEKFEQNAGEQIEYAIRDMPINIFKAIANSESIQSIKNFNETSKLADLKREEWNKDLKNREDKVEILKSELAKYESGFNFVGLFQGFDEMSTEKKTEKNGLLVWLRVFGFLIITPLAAELFVLYNHLENIDKIKNILVLSLLPTITITAIFTYYFRVLLYNYKAVKSQLLQIELRKTLCRFIQHYSEYSSKLKEQDKDSLAKFENIIFAGIVSDDEKLPSSYDGIAQLGSLIKSIRS